MKKPVGLFTALIFTCVILSASPVSAGIEYCWFNKYINVCGTWHIAPTTVYATVGEDVHWLFMIDVSVPSSGPPNYGGSIENVVVKDRFGAEIEIDENVSITGDDWSKLEITYKGNSDKIFLTWNIGTLGPGESATLILEISTDRNPSRWHWQEYTSPGCYELNSGAVLKFTYGGKQYSAHTGSISVEVEGSED